MSDFNGEPAAPAAGSAGVAGIDDDPVELARAFVDSVAWGEHHRVWALLAEEGRRTVFRIAVNRGMEEALVDRLRSGTAAPAEREAFLTDLVNGLRADLQGIDLDALDFSLDATADEPGRARVSITARLPESLAAIGGALPAGSVELVREHGGWRVDRLLPRAGR